MKWLFVCFAVLFAVAPAMAGEDPYIAIVNNDISANTFYVSPKHAQFMFDQVGVFGVPICDTVSTVKHPATTDTNFAFLRVGAAGCESFFSQSALIQPEVCDTLGTGPNLPLPPFFFRGNPNALVTKGNAGFFEWWIRLPKKPSGEINIVVQCGVLKPNTFAPFDFAAIELCAAETGELIGTGICTREPVDPGQSPILNTALPRLTAVAFPGPFNLFDPFNLTAFKNPSAYTLSFDPVTSAMSNNTNSQVLDGSTNARILLKACMDKTVVAKLPVSGQVNALGQTETDLVAGDIIKVRLDIPRQNTVDIYCNVQSARLAGVGESPF